MSHKRCTETRISWIFDHAHFSIGGLSLKFHIQVHTSSRREVLRSPGDKASIMTPLES